MKVLCQATTTVDSMRSCLSVLSLSCPREDYNCHCYVRPDGLGGIVVADMEYPPRVAFATLSTLMNEFDQQNRCVLIDGGIARLFAGESD